MNEYTEYWMTQGYSKPMKTNDAFQITNMEHVVKFADFERVKKDRDAVRVNLDQIEKEMRRLVEDNQALRAQLEGRTNATPN